MEEGNRSFDENLALPVIPELRVTDMGVVDVNQFKTVPLLM